MAEQLKGYKPTQRAAVQTAPQQTAAPQERKEVAKPTPPSIGRIVHYVDHVEGEHLAAIIVSVDAPCRWVNLTVFGSGAGSVGKAVKVEEDQTGIKRGTWHWPEREG